MTAYAEFVAAKMQVSPPVADGMPWFPEWDLFPWQVECVRRTLERGRAALFADTGLGKTRMELSWAVAAAETTGRGALILAPLAVSKQIVREAGELGCEAAYSKGGDPRTIVTVTNYERLDSFDSKRFGAVVLDESSILKGFNGKTYRALVDWAAPLAYRLAASATPAPNDYLELGQHSEFLSVLSAKEMMALYFRQDGNSTTKWRLKGYAEADFWRWVASWAVGMRRPSDVGFPDGDVAYDLPALEVRGVQVEAESDFALGTLFRDEAHSLSERQRARRETLEERCRAVVGLVAAEPDEQWLLWCDLNDESKMLADLIPGAVEVTGTDTTDHKERSLLGFADGEIKVLVSKPSIAGHGMNFQRCARMAFVGLSDSFEKYYQAVRRCWRFGQRRPVHAYVVTADIEGAVVRNIQDKQRKAEAMAQELLEAMADRTLEHLAKGTYESDEVAGDGWDLMLGDCAERLAGVEDGSVGLSVFSPPFPSMYVYTDQARDMGNVQSVEQMIEHFGFLVPELLRVMMPGRSVAIHLAQAQTRRMEGLEIGLKDFRGATITAMEAGGFTFYGEVTIDKDPQVKAIRTKDRGLLFKTLAKDSAHMRMAQADYLLQFRKPGENPQPIRAGTSERYNNEGWITPEEWIEWAAPVWYRATADYPGGIRETDVLNVKVAADGKDERHLCPLQLGVIERAVKLWSAPGDLILSPFAGVGSEGVVALQHGRRFVGVELKRSYYETAARNLAEVGAVAMQLALE